MILAPTGSGKTLAAFLWCIDDLFRKGLETDAWRFERNPDGMRTLYISPLKALNHDIHRNLELPLQGIERTAARLDYTSPPIRTAVHTGDTPSSRRQAMHRRPPHILITTPESLYLLLTSAQGRELFRSLQCLIVDEIHAFCTNKRSVHLSLSLERLMPLCAHEPVPIGLSATQRPLERIAAFLGGQRWQTESDTLQPRPVQIIDCGSQKNLELEIVSPVEDFHALPEGSDWPAVIERLYETIQSHRSTLIFANRRAQAERIARQINELHRLYSETDAPIARAHHGSIAREMRYQNEEGLKSGRIPVVVATASLELGINIGSIDCVVQLQSPYSIAQGIQRVGRSGHALHATSKGKIIPLFRSDLDDAVALAHAMGKGEIGETWIPENCLDGLAQQITAEVAMREYPRLALYKLFRQSYCHRNLSIDRFNSVLDMLNGRYAATKLRSLRPRLNWDKINDWLLPLPGSKLLAVMAGGTIPDDVNSTVYLAESNTRLGDLHEEFALESRVGDTFFLGNNRWRITAITHDRILVEPTRAIKPRPPFWKRSTPSREFETAIKVAAFRRDFLYSQSSPANEQGWQAWLAIDPLVTKQLRVFLEEQRALTGVLPDNQHIVGEFFIDAADEPYVIIHAPFGGRVNGAWAIALTAALEDRSGIQVQYTYNDDGMLFRLPDTAQEPPLLELLRLPYPTIEKYLLQALSNAPIFHIDFRYNAGRAMLLPRSRYGRGIQLWLQRLSAQDLPQSAQRFPDFPILLETCRECLNEVFDTKHYRDLIEAIRAGKIQVHAVRTPHASPMAAGMRFNFLATFSFDTDRSRQPGAAGNIAVEQFAEMMYSASYPQIIPRDLVEETEARWQHRTPHTRARDPESLYLVIEKLGPLKQQQIDTHVLGNEVDAWLKKLQNAGRIAYLNGIPEGWVATEVLALFQEPVTPEKIERRILRSLQTCGPVTLHRPEKALHFEAESITPVLSARCASRRIAHGKLVEGEHTELYCDAAHFAELYRRAIAARRIFSSPVERDVYNRFRLTWHHCTRSISSAETALRQYAGWRFPVFGFERDILRTRVASGVDSARFTSQLLDAIANEQFFAFTSRNTEAGRRSLYFYPRGMLHLFVKKQKYRPAEVRFPLMVSLFSISCSRTAVAMAVIFSMQLNSRSRSFETHWRNWYSRGSCAAIATRFFLTSLGWNCLLRPWFHPLQAARLNPTGTKRSNRHATAYTGRIETGACVSTNGGQP